MIHDNIIYQDKQSAIILENNGRQSISKRTRHINIRYYFITSRIVKSGGIRGILSHPLHDGGLFHKGITGISIPSIPQHRSWYP